MESLLYDVLQSEEGGRDVLSKETGLIPDSPFYAFIRSLRNIGTKVYNVFSNSPKSLSYESGTQFPKDGDFDQELHFDVLNEIFGYSNEVIRSLHSSIDLDKTFDELFSLKPNTLDTVELPGSRLDILLLFIINKNIII